jgi:hypothetical protein
MSIQLVVSPPWPPEPLPTADVGARLRWYAAVARWAPSKHNTQPWRFAARDRSLEFWTDPTRALLESDPLCRELTISCGASVHLACVAARALGYRPQVSLLPDGPAGPLARLAEDGPWQVTDEDRALLAVVPYRRTDRGPLDADQLPPDLPFLLQSAATTQGATLRLVSTRGDRATLANLVGQADRLLVRRGGVDEELAQWLRDEHDPRQDGVPTDHTRGPASSYRSEFVQRDFSRAQSVPLQDRGGPDRPILGVLCTPTDRADQWLLAGRALAAVLLRAELAGAHASYLNQPVEVSALRPHLRDQLALPGIAQLILRLGVGGKVTAPPRLDAGDIH